MLECTRRLDQLVQVLDIEAREHLLEGTKGTDTAGESSLPLALDPSRLYGGVQQPVSGEGRGKQCRVAIPSEHLRRVH